MLTLMIPNICRTHKVHDGLKPIRQHHPRAGVCWLLSMCETHQFKLRVPTDFPMDRFCPPLSTNWSAQPSTSSRLIHTVDGLKTCWTSAEFWILIRISWRHLCCLKLASGRVLVSPHVPLCSLFEMLHLFLLHFIQWVILKTNSFEFGINSEHLLPSRKTAFISETASVTWREKLLLFLIKRCDVFILISCWCHGKTWKITGDITNHN